MMPLRPSVPGRTRIAPVMAAIIGLAACESSTGPGQDPPDEMLFLSSRVAADDGNWATLDKDIFRADASGGAAVNLTDAPADYKSLSLSADGRTVAYIRHTECYAVWAMNTDGSNARQVAGFDPFRCIHMPRISPDGSRIAMTSSRDRQGWVVWVVDTDGSGEADVSSSIGNHGWTWGWTPDGRVVFHFVPAVDEITTYVVNADGTNLQPFFARDGDHSPSWSPDGSRIAFISDREGSNDLYVMNADGTGISRVTDLPGDAWLSHPISINENGVSPWSPDGSRVVFRNIVDTASRLYSVRPDGTDLTPLSEVSMDARYFNGWSHSGRWVAFTGVANGVNLYIGEADGSNTRNTTTSSWRDGHALWLPPR